MAWKYRVLCALVLTVGVFACGDDDTLAGDDAGPSVRDAGGARDAGDRIDASGPRDGGRTADGASADATVADASASDAAVDGGLPAFDCADLPPASGARTCDDFNGAFDAAWTNTQGDTWVIEDGAYRGTGTEELPTPCGVSLFSSAIADGFSASDVRITARLTPLVRTDAVLVLRSRDESNRVELNFRAGHPDGVTWVADLVVQELVGCSQTVFTDPEDPAEQVLVPGNPRTGETIEVVVELIGQRVVVTVNGMPTLDDTFPLATDAGGVGLGVISGGGVGGTPGQASFDYIVVESLD